MSEARYTLQRRGGRRLALARARKPRDAWGRPLRSLRLSVTDRCNLRCSYCMPEARYTWLPRADLLSFDELSKLVEVFLPLGVERLRLTGGEPLLRRDLPRLVSRLAALPGIRDLALTTNGVLLADAIDELVDAGLSRVTVSLDTLDPARFEALTRRSEHARVLQGLERAASAELEQLKLNVVATRGFNDDELPALLAYGRELGAEVRFIEYMDVGGATGWRSEKVIPQTEILDRIECALGRPQPLGRPYGSATATRWALPDGTTFGLVASTTAPFCGDCDRSRLTADGRWLRCLYALDATDLRAPMRAGASVAQLSELCAEVWRERRDRGAESRLSAEGRGPLLEAEQLAGRPHLEMHTRGG